ncbi:membrane-binding protein [Chryseobacterium herbae]|uniref:Membrane-binding protein n=1 Tax=Chryseobacterium herbae TaxID=2976476 RepID=A0ABT2ITF6_9FLAO|nr:membrane-binding protein [Chryseobacterium sp. pc1-10]MCT2562114.1 membrane-binding protein [Chryseobacterium sp. pc1-10]
MKKIFTAAVLALIISTYIAAQEKTYFDENWEKTTQSKMEFYRETQHKGKLTLIKDFYKNGKLRMEALASDTTPGSEIYEGKVITYNPEGKILSTVTFSGGKQLGPAQTFDEKGRLLNDLVYKADGSFIGKAYGYKDPEISIFYNNISSYKNNGSFKTIIYDEDIKGIRSEINTNDKGEYEIKFYGDNGKYIGKTYTNNALEGVSVEYYYNPMKVSKIKKYRRDGRDGIVEETIIYSKNGEILQEEKKNKKDGYKTTYDETGKKIGNLTYVYDKESNSYKPQDGEDYQFNANISGFSTIEMYKNGRVVSGKYFDENGKLYSENVLEDEMIQEIRYYHPDGKLKSTLNYKDGVPYKGTFYDEGVEQQYDDGILLLSKSFREGGKIKSDKKLNAKKAGYDSTVYDEKGTVIYTYIQTLEETDRLDFTTQILQYVKGKPGNKAVVKDGVLQSGKIKYESDSGLRELERTGKWILLKIYDSEGKLVLDNKISADMQEEESFLNTIIQENDLLYEF